MEKVTGSRGFAVIMRTKAGRDWQRGIASLGGKASLNRHKFTSAEAKLAGRKGGRIRWSKRKPE